MEGIHVTDQPAAAPPADDTPSKIAHIVMALASLLHDAAAFTIRGRNARLAAQLAESTERGLELARHAYQVGHHHGTAGQPDGSADILQTLADAAADGRPAEVPDPELGIDEHQSRSGDGQAS